MADPLIMADLRGSLMAYLIAVNPVAIAVTGAKDRVSTSAAMSSVTKVETD